MRGFGLADQGEFTATPQSRRMPGLCFLGYVRRIAISNARVQQIDETTVTLNYKDYRQGARQRQMVLSGEEFVRRFLLHILPKGLMRVRHYGFLANRCRQVQLRQIRRALYLHHAEQAAELTGAQTVTPSPTCSQCKHPGMRCTGIIPPHLESGAGLLRRR